MRHLSVIVATLLSTPVALAACEDNGGPRAARPLPPVRSSIKGEVRTYFTLQPVAGANVSVYGAARPLSAITDKDGRFEIRNVDAGARVQLLVHAPTGHLDTLNPVFLANGQFVAQHVVDVASLQKQYTGLGVSMQTNRGVILGELLQGDGRPRDRVQLAAITIQPPPPAIPRPYGPVGPFFLSRDGLSTFLRESSIVEDRAVFAVINLPVGEYTFTVQYPPNPDLDPSANTPAALTKTAKAAPAENFAVIVRVNDPAAFLPPTPQ